MDKNTKGAVFGAAAILLGFGVVGYYMPAIMLLLGQSSPILGAAAAILFVVAFFGIFWLRGKSRSNNEG